MAETDRDARLGRRAIIGSLRNYFCHLATNQKIILSSAALQGENNNIFGPSGIRLSAERIHAVATTLRDRELVISLVVSDVIDGASRLLNDSQRFGLAIRRVRIDVAEEDLASIEMAVAMRQDMNAEQICARLARHRSVVSIRSEWTAEIE